MKKELYFKAPLLSKESPGLDSVKLNLTSLAKNLNEPRGLEFFLNYIVETIRRIKNKSINYITITQLKSLATKAIRDESKLPEIKKREALTKLNTIIRRYMPRK